VKKAKSIERHREKPKKSSGIKNPRSGQGKSINMELCNGKRVGVFTIVLAIVMVSVDSHVAFTHDLESVMSYVKLYLVVQEIVLETYDV
jgi:hypothetical protein